MASQTQTRVAEHPLNVVVRPNSEAAASYKSAVLAPGFEADPSLDLRYLGGKTIPRLTFTNVYLGAWAAADRTRLDHALAGAMTDPYLNNVLAQYFPGPIGSTFAGSHEHSDATGPRVYRDTLEALVTELDGAGTFTALDHAVSCVCLLLPHGTVLVDGDSHGHGHGVDSLHGLGGYHGSVHVRRGGRRRETVYYAVSVHSEGANGIVAFPQPWQNVCATLYHELCEMRTDPDVEDAIRAGTKPAAERLLGWYSPRGGEIGDIPLEEAQGALDAVLREVPLADGSGSVPVQLMWSNAVAGPEGPISRPHRASQP